MPKAWAFPSERPADTNPLISAKEAAAQLGVTPRTVRNLAQRGVLRSIRVGDRFQFRQSWITDYIERGS